MKFILSSFLSLFTLSLLAQTDSTGKSANDSVTVIIHQDSRLDQLVKKQASINEITSRDSRRTDKGFRLMIISTTSRDEALAAKTKVYTYFPDLKAYLWYQSPYFRVKAGNFKDRKDAENYQKRMNTYFPRGVFIMKDVIEVKPGKGGESDES
ncbi:MAG: SPOR domain-containing protein [Chitinophagaceae bacterium]|nr:SPOR domain-containing protein [Chitinophagaceae bacterium]MBL0269765.1 SPOR domain-containing protein [Chitinophagaceae bacterium]MBP6589564.1 SPOR domain-containing protein [Chitinophagaceae bacterium]MBP8244285.1 SPOR domain-containing protein [Chitinophagaceae bacterium]